MASMYIFTGESSFGIREERRRWTAEFMRKYGEENCTHLDGSTMIIRELLDEVAVMPFLAEKRMVVVDGLPKASKEEVQALESQIHPQVILLFIAPKIDKRGAGAKEFLKLADVKEFTPPKGRFFQQWMVEEATARGVKLDAAAQQLLTEYIGEDQDMMMQEVEKLSQYAGNRVITQEDVERMTIPTDEGVIWKISDLLCAGSKQQALLYAHRMLERGSDPHGMWAILLSWLRNVVAVSAAVSSGMRAGKDISDATGVHPFAVRSLQSYTQTINQKQLRALLTWAARADRDLKTGAIRATDDAPQEILSLIDRLILMA